MWSIEVQQGLEKLHRLQEKYHRWALMLERHRSSPVGKLLAGASVEIRDTAAYLSPWLTGTLSMSHRTEFQGEGDEMEAVVFVSDRYRNPLNQGNPAEYGPIVHGRKPWFEETVTNYAPGIIDGKVSRLIDQFVAHWGVNAQ